MDSTGLTDLARLLPEAVVVVDPGGRLAWANEAAVRLFRTTMDAVQGANALDYVHPEDAALVAAAMLSIQNKEVGSYIEVRVRAGDQWRLVEVVGAGLQTHPTIGGIVLCFRDLTERRRWEVASHEVDRFRALVQHAATIVLLLDADGCVESVSAAVTRVLGHDQEVVEGHPLVDLVASSDRERVGEELARAGQVATSTTTIGAPLVHARDGRAIPFELHVVNLLDDPTVRGMVVSAHDVSRLHRSMAQLAQAQHELARQERLAAVGQLASMIGHELRNPLTAVTNAHFLIRNRVGDALDDKVERHLRMAERETLRAVALAEDLMSFVRPRQLRPEELDAAVVVGEMLEALPPPEQVVVVAELAPSPFVTDRTCLYEMVANLVENAYQAMPDGGTIEVGLGVDGDGALRVTVRDHGTGIEPDVADRIFDPFVTSKEHGTGLGLAIVRRLADEMGGSVSLVNAPGAGAEAELVIPRLTTSAP
ncbi:MAG: ATP-binding protein [Acidimicrobiales bacterium]